MIWMFDLNQFVHNNIDDDLISIDSDYDVNGVVDVEAYENWQPEH